MSPGQTIIHQTYGKAVVISYLKERKNILDVITQTRGVQLELKTEEGKAKYAKDRNGELPYLFESDFTKLN